MVSHKHRCVFIHIPKTAGQSVEKVFLDLHGLDWEDRAPLLLRQNSNPEMGPPRLAHLKAADYVRYQYLSQSLFDSYFKFSFVRNPWTRIVSAYQYLGYEGLISFKSFVDLLPGFLAEGDDFLCPQTDYLFCKGELRVDFVGRFENLQKDFDHVCRTLQLGSIELPHVNRTRKKSGIRKRIHLLKRNPKLIRRLSFAKISSKNYRDYYTPETIGKIRTIYLDDICRFGYESEPGKGDA
jgi:hypothetical protein